MINFNRIHIFYQIINRKYIYIYIYFNQLSLYFYIYSNITHYTISTLSPIPPRQTKNLLFIVYVPNCGIN